MSRIVLTTINARYSHAAAGIRYLYANLKALRDECTLIEFEVTQEASEVAERLLRDEPKIIALGVYIWNVERIRETLEIIRRVRPEVIVILGGPEVSYETEAHPLYELCHFVITGEADHAFRELCVEVLAGNGPEGRVIHPTLPKLETVEAPYRFYSDADIAHRIIYVEASRGCPFTCEFCLSSLEVPVRQFPLDALLDSLDELMKRGLRIFKFVDRTFNLHMKTSAAILTFFLERYVPGMFVHFEMVPDRFPPGLRQLVARFPAGSLQLEVGIQSFNPLVNELISRRQDFSKIHENLTFLRLETRAHVHADLIAGLPGEDVASFAEGFDRLVAIGPQEIQVGVLKRLRGTPIIRHDLEWQMAYNPKAPYEILQNKLIDFLTMQALKRFARYWDLVANSGNFIETLPILWRGGRSPFYSFMRWSEWLYLETGRRHLISLKALTELLFRFLTEVDVAEASEIGPRLTGDYLRGGRSDLPKVLRPFMENALRSSQAPGVPLKRQARAVRGVPVESHFRSEQETR